MLLQVPLQRTQVQLSQAQLGELRARAAREGVSVSVLVRRAIDDLLSKPSDDVIARAIAFLQRGFKGPGDLAERHDEYLAEAYLE